MVRALECFFRIPQYLLRLVESYLNDRELIYNQWTMKEEDHGQSCSGSILGPEIGSELANKGARIHTYKHR